MRRTTWGLHLSVASVVIAMLLAIGCRRRPLAPPPAIPSAPPPIHVPASMLNTPDTVIRSADGSFQLNPAQQIATPFWTQACPDNPTTETFGEALQMGARQVVVSTPFLDQDLYGIIAFCPVPHDVTGPAARLHLVQVPEEYVAATDGGLISVVYEPVQTGTSTAGPTMMCTNTCRTSNDRECDDGGPNHLYNICLLGTDCNDCGPRAAPGAAVARNVPGWVLYLSRQPFPTVAMPVQPGGVAGSAYQPQAQPQQAQPQQAAPQQAQPQFQPASPQ